MLIDVLRTRLGNPNAASFQLMGEDLQALTVEDLRIAAEAQDAAIPEDLRADLMAEEAELAAESHRWLTKYNRSLYGRIAGYVALGKRAEQRYPWPVVAVLGIVQVLGGMDRARVYGLAGRLAAKLGFDRLERLGDGTEDVLRRTNRGIFADSVPTVLRALRAKTLRDEGRDDIAEALIDGSGAVLWDAESRALCRAIADGLGIADDEKRFRALADTTLRHFAREQAIFTHHIASRSRSRKLPRIKSIPAPVIERGKVVYKPFALPTGFDLRDHVTRVDSFGRAFVSSVTQTLAEYRVAVAWVEREFS
ncbi:MAG: hypothetical protein SFX73_40210 [Kofleriaceae bacterium]|nr:hypothetical protein [Kofleriaceae bacterium]